MRKSLAMLVAVCMGCMSVSALSAKESEARRGRGRGRGEGEVRVESERGRTPRQNKVEGVITAVNVTTGQVAIRMRNGVTVVVVATAATKIERNDLHASLAAFRLGDRGQALFDNSFLASKIEATGP